MVKEVVKDIFFLGLKSEAADINDSSVATDLLDTLKANQSGCVGMAANMIGVKKKIIAFENNSSYAVMFNPEIIKCDGKYETEEGCLSLAGTRKAIRYKSIKVRYLNETFKPRIQTFSGFTAQIIQHEIDHTNGIII